MLKRNISYADIPFFISKNPFTGDLNLTRDMNAIRQSIKNIIMTNVGERGFDYKFGCNIYDYLFENFSIDMVVRVQAIIAGNIQRYEGNRVGINDIKIIDNSPANEINIVVDYNIPDAGISDIINVSIARTR